MFPFSAWLVKISVATWSPRIQLNIPSHKQNPATHHSAFVVQLVSFERARDLEGPVLDADGGGVVPLEVTHLSIAEVDKFSKGIASEIKTSFVAIEFSRGDQL